MYDLNFKKIIKFIGIFLIYIFSDLIYVVPLTIFNVSIVDLSITSKCLLMICSDLFVTSILFLIYKQYLIEKFKDFRKNFGKYTDVCFRTWFIGLGFMYLSNYLLKMYSPVKEALNESLVQELITNSPILALILTTILAPFIEEMIFRKGIKDCMNNNVAYIVASGLIFGLLHVADSSTLYDYLYIIPYGSLGCAFAYILAKTDNVYSSIFMHLVHNGILTLISILL